MLKKSLYFFSLLLNHVIAQPLSIDEPTLINPSFKVYLSVTGNDTNIGDSIQPLATFAAALSKIEQLSSSATGNVYAEVVVFPGTYYEIFRQPLNKFQVGQRNLNISLRGKETVVLNGTNLTVNAGGGMIYLLGSNIFVKNITVLHSNENGVRFGYNYAGTVINSHDVLIDGVTVSETAGHGILTGIGCLNANGSSNLIPRAKRFKIVNCHVYNSVNYNTPQSQWGSAIKFWNTSNNIALNNHVHDNSGEGIDFDFCDSAIVKGNLLHDNYANIYLDKIEYALIQQNFIYNETKVVSGILTGLEAFTSFITNHYIKDVYIENNIILNTLGINLWQGIYSAIQNGIYSNIKIRHNTIIGKQRGNGALVSISHETFLGQPVSNFSISDVSVENNIMSAHPDSLNNNKILSAPLNPQPGLTTGNNLYNMNPGFAYNSNTDQINSAITKFEPANQAVLNLTPNSILNPELIKVVPYVITNDYHGFSRNSIATNAGAIEKNESIGINFTQRDDLVFFPNPSNGFLKVKEHKANSINKIMAYDMKGLLVFSMNTFEFEPLDLRNFKNGLYTFIVFTKNGEVITNKIQINN